MRAAAASTICRSDGGSGSTPEPSAPGAASGTRNIIAKATTDATTTRISDPTIVLRMCIFSPPTQFAAMPMKQATTHFVCRGMANPTLVLHAQYIHKARPRARGIPYAVRTRKEGNVLGISSQRTCTEWGRSHQLVRPQIYSDRRIIGLRLVRGVNSRVWLSIYPRARTGRFGEWETLRVQLRGQHASRASSFARTVRRSPRFDVSRSDRYRRLP